MTMLEIRAAILNNLKAAVQYSIISPEILNELAAIELGENPRDIIGVRWCDMIDNRWDTVPAEDLAWVFNRMA